MLCRGTGPARAVFSAFRTPGAVVSCPIGAIEGVTGQCPTCGLHHTGLVDEDHRPPPGPRGAWRAGDTCWVVGSKGRVVEAIVVRRVGNYWRLEQTGARVTRTQAALAKAEAAR